MSPGPDPGQWSCPQPRTHPRWLCVLRGQPVGPGDCAGRYPRRLRRSRTGPPRCSRRPGTRWGTRRPPAARAGLDTAREPAARPGRRRRPGAPHPHHRPGLGGCARRGRRRPRAAERSAGVGCRSRRLMSPPTPPAPSRGARPVPAAADRAHTPAGRAAWRGRAPAARTPGSRRPAGAERHPRRRRRPGPGSKPTPGSGTSSPARL